MEFQYKIEVSNITDTIKLYGFAFYMLLKWCSYDIIGKEIAVMLPQWKKTDLILRQNASKCYPATIATRWILTGKDRYSKTAGCTEVIQQRNRQPLTRDDITFQFKVVATQIMNRSSKESTMHVIVSPWRKPKTMLYKLVIVL